ncbi:hypothetical protein OIU76_028955 [Salix suchowensis]|nr:hypothetical protein OIU76_028955 [Salix suchowensis]
MVTIYQSGVISKCHIYPGVNTHHDASFCKITHVSTLTTAISPSGPCNSVEHDSTFSWKGRSPLRTHHVLQRVVSNRWLCRSHDSNSPDDEYGSSRNIAISLFRRYRNVIDRGGGDNLKEFISAGVNAYARCRNYGGSTSVKSKIFAEEVDECILWLSIIFITILCTPQPTIVRWSSTPSVSDDIRLQWKGFCAIIANAYYMRGMAWLPVKTLQLEQMANSGRAEEPSVVASRMRLVFSTLEVVSPQWPRF